MIKLKVVGFATHNQAFAYGCSVPRLTRFAGLACMGPDRYYFDIFLEKSVFPNSKKQYINRYPNFQQNIGI